MTQFGQLLNSLASLDSSLTVSAGSVANGTSKDLGANINPQALRVAVQFSLTQTATNDAADVEAIVQFSDDNSTWPDSGDGDPIWAWLAASAGADKTRTQILGFVPRARYYRFQYTNNNPSDSFDVNSETSHSLNQDDA